MVGVLGIMLGSGFAPEILDRLGDWTISLLGLALYPVVVTGVVTWFLSRICGYDPVTAFFSAAPGALSAMVVVGRQFGSDGRINSQPHTARILLVGLARPFLLQ